MTASEYAIQLNNEARERMAATPGLWIGMLAEDAEHWAEYGIETADQLGAYLDACVEAATTEADRNYFEREEEGRDWGMEWYDTSLELE